MTSHRQPLDTAHGPTRSVLGLLPLPLFPMGVETASGTYAWRVAAPLPILKARLFESE